MYVAQSPPELTDHDQLAAEQLGEHLALDHARRWREDPGMPLRALHDLEHLEASMGLLELRHSH
jgi:hypothetical protein